ncbi:MAG: HypC/HybG/HupF family hydrogenase formation chaperone [Chromatiaceae bacterium]|nr:MAG: HypC/HybG/HupF family hydrogenase formation chaperone [Chromatiaceae bacterium]
MCLAIPAQVLSVDPATATAMVNLDGVRRSISLALVETVAVGDYVLVHVGYALNRISPEEAAQTLALMQEAGALAGPPSEAASPRPGERAAGTTTDRSEESQS